LTAALKDYTLAVVGAGKIGQAIIRASRDCVGRVIGTARRQETLKAVEDLGAEATRDNRGAVRQADLIVISVKPHHFASVAREIGEAAKGKVVVSVVAGVKLSTIERVLPGSEAYRAMPNINALIAKSTTAIAPIERREAPSAKLAEGLLGCLGSVYWIPEEWMDAWTALVGSGPAFMAEIVDALVLGAVMVGMPRELAYKALLDAVKATAEHLERRSVHPLQLRDEVTTPAGTTIHGLIKLESEGVKAGLMKVVEASTRRGRELGALIDTAVRRSLGV
jgi:pyrroline-5-carboxylate reductase